MIKKNMKRRMTACVIGVGNMGRHHARIYNSLDACELKAVCDSNIKTAQEIAMLFGVKAFSDFTKMLEEIKPDLVSIAVPTTLHKTVAVKALEYSNVLIEKPVALNIQEAQEIDKAARQNGKNAMVGHVERFNPAITFLKNYVQEHNEKVLSLDFVRIGLNPPANPTTGVITDLAIHDIDLTRFITGEEVTRAIGALKSFGLSPFEDHVHLFLQTKNTSASIVSNWINPRKLRRIIVTLQRALLEINLLNQEISVFEKNHEDPTLEGKPKIVSLSKEEPLVIELKQFVEVVQGTRENPISISDATKTLGVAESILKS